MTDFPKVPEGILGEETTKAYSERKQQKKQTQSYSCRLWGSIFPKR